MTITAAESRTLYPDTIIAAPNPSVVAGEMGPPRTSRASAAASDDLVTAFSTNDLARPQPPKFRNFLIKRENSLCAISKFTTFDFKNNQTYKINQETKTVESLEAAHIFPFSFFSVCYGNIFYISYLYSANRYYNRSAKHDKCDMKFCKIISPRSQGFLKYLAISIIPLTVYYSRIQFIMHSVHID